MADRVEVEPGNRLAIRHIGEPEADERSAPMLEGEAGLVVDDLAEGLVVVSGGSNRSEDDRL